jgi:hypothetical protein
LKDELELEDLPLELELDDLASTGIGKLQSRKPTIVSCVNLLSIQ